MNKACTTHLHYPLSVAQQGIWLGQKIHSGSAIYNTAEAIEIMGPLNIALFSQAIELVCAKAAALRMQIFEVDDAARQRIVSSSIPVKHLDFSKEENVEKATFEWMKNNVETPISLEHGPLARQALIRMGQERTMWYQCIHHIAADGYSYNLITQKVAELYTALLAEKQLDEDIFEEFEWCIKEATAYQESDKFHKDRQYWAKSLHQMPQPATLSRSDASISANVVRSSYTFNSHAFTAIKQNFKSDSVTWVDTLLASVVQLVGRKTAVNDLTIGVPMMGRMGSVTANIPAMVMNIVPLRIKIQRNDSLHSLSTTVARQLLQAKRHQRYRYEQMRRDVNKVGGDKKLYGPVVNILPFSKDVRVEGCSTKTHRISAGPVEDISFTFVLTEGGELVFDLEANPDRYSIDMLQTIRDELCDDIQRLSKADEWNAPLSNSQNIALLKEQWSWLEGKALTNGETVLQLLLKQLTRNDNRVALVEHGKQWRYSELLERISVWVAVLTEEGVTADDRVALVLPRSETSISLSLSLLFIGATYIFLDPEGPEQRNKDILNSIDAKLIIHSNKRVETLCANGSSESIAMNKLLDSFHKNLERNQTKSIKDRRLLELNKLGEFSKYSNSTAYIKFTSGSTGTPKGIAISQGSLSEFINGAMQCYEVSEDDRVLQFAPLHFDTSVEEIYTTLCAGGSLFLRDDTMMVSIADFLQNCEIWNIRIIDLPTAFWHELVFYCVTLGKTLPACIERVIIGGEAVLPERVQQWHEVNRFNAKLLNTYGPTETTVVVSCAHIHSQQKNVTSIGQPLPGRVCVVVDEYNHLVPIGEVGELVIAGIGIGEGYWKDSELTKRQFINLDVYLSETSLKAYKTGDKARIHPAGFIEYLGRLDDELKISGHRINPLEVENAILGVNLVSKAAVVGDLRSKINKQLIAFIEKSPQSDMHDQELKRRVRHHLQALLPAPMVPGNVVIMDRLPLNAAGKIDKKSLRLLNISGSSLSRATNRSDKNKVVDMSGDVSSVAEGDEQAMIEKSIVHIWKEVIGLDDVSREDDFFIIGGSSLQSIQVVNRLSALMRRNIPINLLFQHPVVSNFAEAILTYNEDVKPIIKPLENVRLQIEKDTQLPSDLVFNKIENKKEDNSKNKIILLTGATGFVGVHLLARLLKVDNVHIICLVRANNVDEAYLRLRKAFDQQEIALNDQDTWSRVTAIPADIGQPWLGLEEHQFHSLSQQVDITIHNAAVTSVVQEYQSLYRANVFSTKELIRLSAKRNTPIHYVSTIAVAPPKLLKEQFLDWHVGLLDGYQQSKWASERCLEKANANGLPVKVYRLARVVGDVHRGGVNKKDLVWQILQSSSRINALPITPIEEPWTPVDTISAFIAGTVEKTLNQDHCDSNAAIFNLLPEKNVKLNEVFQWYRELLREQVCDARSARDLDVLPFSEWLEKLNQSQSAESQALANFFNENPAIDIREFDEANKDRANSKSQSAVVSISGQVITMMDALSLKFPTFNKDIFSRYLRYAITHNMISISTISEGDYEYAG